MSKMLILLFLRINPKKMTAMEARACRRGCDLEELSRGQASRTKNCELGQIDFYRKNVAWSAHLWTTLNCNENIVDIKSNWTRCKLRQQGSKWRQSWLPSFLKNGIGWVYLNGPIRRGMLLPSIFRRRTFRSWNPWVCSQSLSRTEIWRVKRSYHPDPEDES